MLSGRVVGFCVERLNVQNGLLQDWWGTVYCNPPYGSHVGIWMRKMAEHGDGIALIFARIETSCLKKEILLLHLKNIYLNRMLAVPHLINQSPMNH